jgi:hypothetical protein
LERENERLAVTDWTGNGRRKDINKLTEKQNFGNNRRM